MTIFQKLGNEIKRRRSELGLSQEKFAHLCDFHRTYIGSIERGERNVSLRGIAAIARALKCAPSDLLVCLNGK
jgi:transcriptional regulator with XRE-family HTH domain